MDRGPWWATVHGVTRSQTRLKRLSTHMHMDTHWTLGQYGEQKNREPAFNLVATGLGQGPLLSLTEQVGM